ncbi:MAG: HTTM domain-containing protein [Myxococcales bacterium]|nr:HTTM domain-containing protein [Myxococcales bacterium]
MTKPVSPPTTAATPAGPLSAFDRYWMAPAPAARLAALRVLVGAFSVVYLVARGNVLANFSRMDPQRFEPVGLAAVLSAPLPAALVWALYALCLVAGLGFTLGYRYRISGPLFALLFAWVTSYRNSWGMIFHTDNLTLVHLVCLGLAPTAADAYARDHRGDDGRAEARHGWPIRLLCAVTVVVYVLAGIAKLRNSGMDWAEGEILRNYIAYDGMRKAALGSLHSPLGAWLVQYAWPFPIIGALTLVVELGAPVAMFGPRLGRFWVLGIWGFHLGVLLTMAIAFPYPLCGIAFAPFLPAERIFGWRWPAPLWRLLATESPSS